MSEKTDNARLEAFCDGVFAIAITLLILEIKIPKEIDSAMGFWKVLLHDWPSWFGFGLSFMIIFIAWVNHHNVFKLLNKNSAQFIYANGFLLLTIVILPFSTGLMAEYLQTEYVQPAVTFYCFTALLHNLAWVLFGRAIEHPVDLTKSAESAKQLRPGNVNARYAFVVYTIICLMSIWFPVTALILITSSWIAWIIIGVALTSKTS